MNSNEWLKSLKGKTEAVVLLLLQGVAEDQIVLKVGTTLGYVRKLKSILVGKGLMPKRAKRSSVTETQSSNDRSMSNAPNIILNDSLSADIANAVYSAFDQKISLLEIAKKYNLRAPQVIALKKEWIQLKDLQYLEKMYAYYEEDGTRDIVWLCHYMKEQNQVPRKFVQILVEISNVTEFNDQLQTHNHELTQKNQNLAGDEYALECRVSPLRSEVNQLEKSKAQLQTYNQTLESQKNELEDKIRKSIELKKNLQADAFNVAIPPATQAVNSILKNDVYRWKCILDSVIISSRKDQYLTQDFFSKLTNPFIGLKPNFPTLTRLYVQLFENWYEHLFARSTNIALETLFSSYELLDSDLKRLIGLLPNEEYIEFFDL